MWRRVLPCLAVLASAAGCDNTAGDADELNASAGGAGTSDSGVATGGVATGGVAIGGVATGGVVTALPLPRPPLIQVDPEVSAGYSWSECGRIEAGMTAVTGQYTPDESLLILEAGGRLVLYPGDSGTAITLLPPSDGASGALSLSADGRRLYTRDGIYASAMEGEPIGANTTAITLLATLAPSTLPCSAELSFSSDASLVLGAGIESVCIWETETGALRSEFPTVARDRGASDVALLGQDSVVLFRFPEVFRYSLDGELLTQVTAIALSGNESLWAAQFTPDGQVLLFDYYPDRPSASATLVAIETETGAELWRRPFAAPSNSSFAISSDGTVVVQDRGPVLRIADGEQVGSDVSAMAWPVPVVGPAGRRRLLRLELLGSWDLLEGKPLRLFGSHQERIRDLDISHDGRYLASHGRRAAVWRLDDEDFSQSVPLLDGAAPDDSWNVAISSDGRTLAVSGDNLAFFRLDGSWRGADAPAGAPISCLSADWAFSPTGAWAAGTNYGQEVKVIDALTLESRAVLPASSCQSGVAFSPDGTMLATARLELFDTATWSRLRGPMVQPEALEIGERAVRFSPDGATLVITRCSDRSGGGCRSGRYDVSTGLLLEEAAGLSGRHARYSPEGHWLLSGNHLLHVPTGRLVEYAPDALVALFAPNGDIIAGESDGSLVRYCQALN